jgi:hypothetical protein
MELHRLTCLPSALKHPYREAPVVHDDDSSSTWNVGREDEPPNRRPPRDEHTRDLILDTARTNPNWGPLRIHEELRADGYDLDEAEVSYVLHQYTLPNLHR